MSAERSLVGHHHFYPVDTGKGGYRYRRSKIVLFSKGKTVEEAEYYDCRSHPYFKLEMLKTELMMALKHTNEEMPIKMIAEDIMQVDKIIAMAESISEMFPVGSEHRELLENCVFEKMQQRGSSLIIPTNAQELKDQIIRNWKKTEKFK